MQQVFLLPQFTDMPVNKRTRFFQTLLNNYKRRFIVLINEKQGTPYKLLAKAMSNVLVSYALETAVRQNWKSYDLTILFGHDFIKLLRQGHDFDFSGEILLKVCHELNFSMHELKTLTIRKIMIYKGVWN